VKLTQDDYEMFDKEIGTEMGGRCREKQNMKKNENHAWVRRMQQGAKNARERQTEESSVVLAECSPDDERGA